ncbi:MAG: CPBP family intramembrane metalloprotease, partial [Anaerolineales bacterium]|nr:CPBP family intramembrane metalloprotease [Anaerolineales bacterium]
SWKSLGIFFALTFVWTWAFMIPAVSFVPENYSIFLIVISAFGPFLSAMVTTRVFDGKEKLHGWLRTIFRLKIPVYLYLAGAFLIPVLIGSLQFLAYRILGGVPDPGSADPWYMYLFALIPTALLTGGNEEPGWRGYALPVLNKLTTPLLAGLILGVVHSLWHLPLMGRYETNIFWYAFNLIPLTYLFNWFYQKSRGSIWPVMLFHAGTNVIGFFMPTPLNVLGIEGDFLVLRGIVYWIMFAVLSIFLWKPWAKKETLFWEDQDPSLAS